MITSLKIENEGTEDDPSFTLMDQQDNYLADSVSIEVIIKTAKQIADKHGLNHVVIKFS